MDIPLFELFIRAVRCRTGCYNIRMYYDLPSILSSAWTELHAVSSEQAVYRTTYWNVFARYPIGTLRKPIWYSITWIEGLKKREINGIPRTYLTGSSVGM